MLFTVLAAAIVAQASAAAPRNCLDDNHTDRCSAADRARVTTLLGMASAEAEAQAGVEAYRVFFVDGYGRTRPAVAFERRPGENPKIVVYAPDGKIEAPAPAAAWRFARADGKFADRTLVDLPSPAAPGETPFPRICLHSWVTSVEIVNAPTRGDAPEPVRLRTENACDSGLATKFGFDLAALATRAFPACETLKPENYRNDVERLAFCATLAGDQMAAADLANQIGPYTNDLAEAREWQRWMGANARLELNWAGQMTKDPQYGDRQAAGFLAAQSKIAYLSSTPRVIEGLTSQSVRVQGTMERVTKSNPEVREEANYEQVWVWDTAMRGWMVKSWTIGSFSPAK